MSNETAHKNPLCGQCNLYFGGKNLILHGGEENVKWERNEISQEDNVTYWCNQEDATYEILVLRKK